MKPTVFISSVIEGFADQRAAAAAGVVKGGAIPVRVEDLPSQDRSPRNVCLDLVEDSDVYLVIVGERGGWTAPSGAKVTEEEYEHARKMGKPIVAFVEEVEKDPDAERLAQKVSDYVDGRYRRTFGDSADLAEAVETAIQDLMPRFYLAMRSTTDVQRRASETGALQDEATMRLIVATEREDELIDPVILDDQDFLHRIYRIGHDASVALFSYEHQKKSRVRGSTIEIVQVAERSDARPLVRLTLETDGIISLDLNVTGRRSRGRGHDLINSLALVEDDVVRVAELGIRSIEAFLDDLDPHKRHDRLLLQVALGGIGHRKWTRDASPRNSFGMRMSGPDPVYAFEEPRAIARAELPGSVGRVVALLRRQVDED